MAKNYVNYDRIANLSVSDNEVPLVNKALKLSEEVGEFSQAMLKHLGSKNVSASAGNKKENVLEELCDVINIAVDIINAMGFTDEETSKMFEKKLDKWEAKTKKY
jgi:NTP pyrophosphatase (non-canonical NTP hydrolase)